MTKFVLDRQDQRDLVKDERLGWTLVLKPEQVQFIEWLTDPERAANPQRESQAAFARRIGVDPSTLTKWKKDRSFKKHWEQALADKNVSPDRLDNIMEAMYEKARSGDVKAAELYMKLVDRMSPEKHMVVTQDVTGLSDEALRSLVAGNGTS